MSREVDDKKTRKALRKIDRAKRAAKQAEGDDNASSARLSEWEDEFIDSVEERLEKFGSAFTDPEKGKQGEALSAKQAWKLKEIEMKAKGKPRKPMSRGKGFNKNKAAKWTSRDRDINADIPQEAPPPDIPEADDHLIDHNDTQPAPVKPAKGFNPRVIKGGKGD